MRTFLRWVWHETFGYHNWKCIRSEWIQHRRVVTLSCTCEAEITRIEAALPRGGLLG